MRHSPDRTRERGAALLTVLLLVAVVGALSALALDHLRIATRLGANMAAIDQARGLAMAAETAAIGRVNALLTRDGARVTLDGGWADRPVPFPVPEGSAVVRVRDAGNCFNLNGLVTQAPDGRLVARIASIEQFRRLMSLIGIGDRDARAIAAASADWIDTDSDPLPGGAEDGAYADARPRYLPANTLMADVSELRAVRDVTPALYEKLSPWLCALPIARPSRININTLAPDHAALLAAMLPEGVDPGRVRAALSARPAGGFASAGAFWQSLAQGGLTTGPEVAQQSGVTTQWFALDAEVALGGAELRQIALIDASRPPQARVVARAWSDP